MMFASLNKSVMIAALAFTAVACTFPTTSAGAANNGSRRDADEPSYDASNCPVYGPPRQLRLIKSLPETNVCEGRGTSIVALTDDQVLFLCKNGQEIDNFDFSMGTSGVDKRKEGDRKTPLGTYRLGQPRSSEQFGTFIPVGYPTKEQKAKGFTGADVGIHGPDRRFRCAGFLNVTINWTQGCLAVADDSLIEQVANFVKQNPGLPVHIMEKAPGSN